MYRLLVFVVIVLLALPSRSQPRPWQIKGVLSALGDKNGETVDFAVERLEEWGILDSLIGIGAIPQQVMDKWRGAMSTDDSATLNQRYVNPHSRRHWLSCQDPIPDRDRALLKQFLVADSNGFHEEDAFWVTPRVLLYPELRAVFKKNWTRTDPVNKVYWFTLARWPQTLGGLYDSLLTDYLVETRASDAQDSRLGVFERVLCDTPLTPAVVGIITHEIKKSPLETQQSLFSTLATHSWINKQYGPLFKEMARALHQEQSDEYYEGLCRQDLLTTADSGWITAWFEHSSYHTQETFVYCLADRPSFSRWQLRLIGQFLTAGSSVNRLFSRSTRDAFGEIWPSTFFQRPDLLPFIRSAQPTDSSAIDGVMEILMQQPVVPEDDFIKVQTWLRLNKPDWWFEPRLYDGHIVDPRVIDLFRHLPHNSAGEITMGISVLLDQPHYSEEDLTLFENEMNSSQHSEIKQPILSKLTRQQLMQSEVIKLLSHYIASSEQNSQDFAEYAIYREQLPDTFWSSVLRVVFHDEREFNPFLDHSQLHIPEQYSYWFVDAVDSFNRNQVPFMRFMAYYAGEGSPGSTALLKWVAQPGANTPPISRANAEEDIQALVLFDSLWDRLEGLHNLRKDIAGQVTRIFALLPADKASAAIDIGRRFVDRFRKESLPEQAAQLQNTLHEISHGWVRFIVFFEANWYFLTLHPLLWLGLIAFYPKSRRIQSVFFWNETVRKWGGLGYVNLLLIHVGFLRHRLLQPFKENLLEEAQLDALPTDTYFTDFPLVSQQSGSRLPLIALQGLRGPMVITGASGLGKTLLLRHLLAAGGRDAVFVSAARCKDGVEAAISAKLLGVAQEDSFVKAILYNGFLDVYIDGLNEVGPETRVRIAQFVSQFRYGRTRISTQPIAWSVPETATVIEILPLERDKIANFLHTRYGQYSPVRPITQAAYQELCDNFLDRMIGEGVSGERRVVHQKVLSNPFDATIVGQLLIHHPDKPVHLLNLQEEYFGQMAAYYQATFPLKGTFPLAAFAEAIYIRHLADDPRLPYDEFPDEVFALQQFKMAIPLFTDNQTREWRFRHDKIKDFVLLQTFFAHPERQEKHMADPRFRGVYFLLAALLPIPEARTLERLLIDYSVDTNDHILSSEFIRILRDRSRTANEAA